MGERVQVTRHWTINGRFLSQGLTGVQRYAREIVRALDAELIEGHALARALDLRLVVPRGADRLDLQAIRTIETDRAGGHLWEQAVLPRHVEGGLVSLGNAGPLAVRRQIVCMHDMNTRTCPESYSALYRAAHRLLQPLLGRRVAAVATVSRYSAEQLVRHGICGPDRIAVMPNGHEHALRWRPRHSARTRAAAGPDTIVMIGTPAPHKNIRLILGMAERLAEAGMRIAVAGAAAPRVFRPDAEAAPFRGVTWLGRVSDGEMAALLQDSLCLAFPSLTEGFGLPPLEAMALGCPVVVSDRTSLPDLCGAAALYASPVEPDQWFAAFRQLHGDPDLRARLVERGRDRAQLFSWAESARLYLAAMARIDGVPVPRDSGGGDITRAAPDLARRPDAMAEDPA